MATTIQVRVDDDLKTKADSLFKSLGTDTTNAVRMFLTQAVLQQAIPFDVKVPQGNNPYFPPLTAEEIYEMLAIAREHSSDEQVKDATLVGKEMREKYGL